jgi:hypothetical protein
MQKDGTYVLNGIVAFLRVILSGLQFRCASLLVDQVCIGLEFRLDLADSPSPCSYPSSAHKPQTVQHESPRAGPQDEQWVSPHIHGLTKPFLLPTGRST